MLKNDRKEARVVGIVHVGEGRVSRWGSILPKAFAGVGSREPNAWSGWQWVRLPAERPPISPLEIGGRLLL
ncbi:MAG: hypothetical protein HG464_000250 [Bacteroidia bacterium]|nr:hypothetical protein [Bacteroidia bacterium]